MPKAESQAQQAGQIAHLILLDAVGLSAINKDHGRPTGDRILIKIAETLSNWAAPNDIIVRMGADEFAILTIAPPTRSTTQIVEQLHAAFADNSLKVTIGTATCDSDTNFADAWAKAEQAMYEGKGR